MKLEFRVTCEVGERLPDYLPMERFVAGAVAQIESVLHRHWSMLDWTVITVPPGDGTPALAIATADPRFDPCRPVVVNGYTFAPAEWPGATNGHPSEPKPAFQQVSGRRLRPTGTEPGWSKAFRDPIAYPPKRRDGCGPARREGDEYVCPTAGCGLRWSVDEEKPGCPI